MRTLLLSLTLGLLLPFSVHAQENLLPSAEDVYLAAEDILLVNTTVGGDAFVFGGLVRVQEDVPQDLHIAGGQVDIDASIGDDVRVVGGDVTIAGSIGGDLIVMGGDVHVRRGSVVEGNINVMGGKVFLDGQVDGDIMARSGLLHITGLVNGNIDVKGEDITLGGRVEGDAAIVAEDITVKSTASLQNVRYWIPEHGSIDNLEEVAAGTVVFDESLRPMILHKYKKKRNMLMKFAGKIGAIVTLFSLLSAALIAIFLVWFNKTFFTDVTKRLQKSMWKEFGVGLLFFVATPIIALLLMATIVGIPLGLFVFMLWGFTLFFAFPVSGVVLAYVLRHHYKKKWGPAWTVLLSVGFYAFLKIIFFIPFIGWIAALIIVCMCVGASASTELSRWQKVR